MIVNTANEETLQEKWTIEKYNRTWIDVGKRKKKNICGFLLAFACNFFLFMYIF